MLRILFIFSLFFVASPCFSMDNPALLQSNKIEDFENVKLKLSKKVQNFKYHVEDTIDYWEYLKTTFDPDNPANIKNYKRNLNKLNAYDRKICEDALASLEKDKEYKRYPAEILQAATMQSMMSHFDKKITSLTQSLEQYTLFLKAINSEDKNLVFLSFLSQYILYFQSRYQKITSDPSPIFSAYANDYRSYEKHQIKNEITKNELLLEFIQSLYPFVQDDLNIQKFLAYCPVLSNWLTNPLLNTDLDAFCLDAIIMMFHNGIKTVKNHEENLSTKSEDILFINKTQIPLIDISLANPILDSTFQKERNIWNRLYQMRIEKFAPKIKPNLSIETSPLLAAPVVESSPSQETANKPIPAQQNKSGNQKEVKEVILTPNFNETTQTDEKPQNSSLIPQIAPDDRHDPDFKFEDNLINNSQEPLKEVEVTRKRRAQNKLDKKQAKALAPRLGYSKSETTSLIQPTQKMLTEHDIIELSRAHYEIIHGLLNDELSPNVRYNDIISALVDRNVGIRVEALGNGDYRKLHLPNGRKIFIYRPAVPQVGKRFLKILRDGLLEKWNLKANNLSYR